MTDAPPVTIDGDTLRVRFDRFNIPAYRRFLQVKALPEYHLTFDPEDESYAIDAPARYAAMLGCLAPSAEKGWIPLPEWMFDDQVHIVKTALDVRRFACWSDCGLGKTLILLEFARQVCHKTGGRFLIFTLNEIVGQFVEMAAEFYGESLQMHRIHSRAEMRQWCKEGPGQIAITNYEKMNPDKDGQVVNELRYLAGVGVDESSRLAQRAGKQKWALIHSTKGVQYKLSCTATPAPNDYIEFASQASFLERMRNENDIIWTFFHRDPVTQEWTVKRHARQAFFEWMAAWSIYVRDPRRYGWRKNHGDVPPPEIIVHQIQPTDEQVAFLQREHRDKTGQMSLIDTCPKGIVSRGKLSQIAKGFRYIKGQQGKYRLVPSRKPGIVGEIVDEEIRAGLQTLVWTVFDAESTLIAEELERRKIVYEMLTGKTKPEARLAILDRFRHGESTVLVSRANMLGFGQNFQKCGAMVFSGFNDSYVQWYQAIRRAVRYGQTRRVRVHVPLIPMLEGDMYENLLAKQDRHEAAIAEMEANYITALKRLRMAA